MIAAVVVLPAWTASCGGSAGSGSNGSSGTASAPGTPTGVAATAGNANAVISRTAPGNGGSVITGYTVTVSPGGATVGAGGATAQATAAGLSDGTTYTFTVYATNAIRNGPRSRASAPVTPQASSAISFPLLASSSGRYLSDKAGIPVPILGRAAWFVISLSATDYQTFINDTAAKGYNAIEINAITHDPRANLAPYANGKTLLPFLKRLDGTAWTGSLSYTTPSNEAPDFTTPNPAYWSFLDSFLSYCQSKGIVVFMFPSYLGYGAGNQGWAQEMVANGVTKMSSFGNWIATRYQNQTNLVWMLAGDYGGPSALPANLAATENSLIGGIKSVKQSTTLYSAELGSGSISTDDRVVGPSITLNGAYDFDGEVVTQGRRAYSYASTTLPSFLLEEPYDQEGPDGNNVNRNATQPVRRFQWWGWLSTVGGYISGNGYVWPFTSGWNNHLNTQGAQDMARLNAFIKSIAWWKLVPSGLGGIKNLITAGGGSGIGGPDYVAAAADAAGSLLVAYVPPAHSGSITVDMSAMSGPALVRWFDPTTASYSPIGTYPNTGTQTLNPPGRNSTGYTDWALVIQAL